MKKYKAHPDKHEDNTTAAVSRAPKTKLTLNNFYRSERFWSITTTVVLLLLAIGVAGYLRFSTVDVRLADEAAKQNLDSNGFNVFYNQVKQTYPTLPDAAVRTEATKQWTAYKAEHKAEYDTQVKALAAQYRNNYQYTTSTPKPYEQTYILEMDPYLWWHQAVNYADTGSVCDPGSKQLPNNVCIDAKRLAPLGTTVNVNFHVWLESVMIRVMRVIDSNLDSMTVVFYLPALLAMLAVIPAFFIGKKIAGNVGAFTSGMIIATHPVLINRTTAGFSDTDGYAFLFTLLVLWFILLAVDAKKLWQKIVFAATTALFMSVALYASSGGFFTVFVVLACLIGLVVYRVAQHFVHRRNEKWTPIYELLIIFGALVVSTAIFTSLILNFQTFLSVFTAPFSLSSTLQAATSSADVGWPNILTTVAELNIPSLPTIIGNLGGQLLIVFAAFGSFASLLNPRKVSWATTGLAIGGFIYYYFLITKGLGFSTLMFFFLLALPLLVAVAYIFIKNLDIDLRYAVFVMGFLLASFFATTKGIRFLLLGIPAFAIGFGIGIGWLCIYLRSLLKQEIKKPFLIDAGMSALMLFIVFNPFAGYSPVHDGIVASNQQVPGMNDAWWESMRAIREGTPADTIITSWWDFGHWFRNVGNRSVTFDGGSQNPEPGHWVGKLLLTSNEEEAVGILRMLDCGQNTAYEVAHKTLDVAQAVALVDSLVVTDKAGAQKLLAKTGIPADDQTSILQATHCTPPHAVFITSNDMIGKAAVWGHFGAWDFRKSMAYEYSKLPQAEALTKIQSLNFTPAEALSMYTTIKAFASDGEANGWIAPWPGYFIQDWKSCSLSADGNNTSTVTCTVMQPIQQAQQGVVVLEAVSFPEKDPSKLLLAYALYDPNSGTKLGPSATGTLSKIVVADVDKKKITTIPAEGAGFTIGALISKDTPEGGTTPSYSVLLTDPLHTDSVFAQLYFLDGAFSKYFTKFNDQRAAGIIVWNVTWPKD